jgi:septal ring factor EnvC (AmiA/AmiB activator)
MSFENQLGSVIARLRTIEAQITAIEMDLAVEKAKLAVAANDIKIIQDELRPKQ